MGFLVNGLVGGAVARRHIHNAVNFVRVQRFGEYIVAPEIQDLGPEKLVRMTRQDDQRRRVPEAGHKIVQVLPVPVGQLPLARNDRRLARIRKKPRCFPHRPGTTDCPMVLQASSSPISLNTLARLSP